MKKSHNGTKAKRAVGILLSALIAGCATQGDISSQSLKANLAVEDAHNQLLLVNILRAYKQRPMYFTGIRTLRGPLGSGSPTFSFRIPFGPDFTNNVYEFSPTFKPDVAQYDINVMDTQDFMRGITQPLPPKILQYYLDQGWPKQFVLHLFVREVRIFEGEASEGRLLNYPLDRTTLKSFQDWISAISLCDIVLERVDDFEPVGPILKDTEVRDIAKLAAMKKEGLSLIAVDEKGKPIKENVHAYGYQVRKLAEGVTFKLKTNPQCPEFPENIQQLMILADQTRLPLKVDDKIDSTGKKPRRAILLLRSPEAMLYYVGEIVRRQLEGTLDNPADKEEVRITLRHPEDAAKDKLITIFSVRRVPNGHTVRAAVSVTYDGETYVIPGTEEEAGRSMHVLSLISQLIGLQNKATDLPQTTTVRVIQ